MSVDGVGREPDVRGSALWSTIGIGLQGLVRLAYTVLVGRIFGPEVLGHTSALLTLSIILTLLWPVPAANSVSRFFALADAGGHDRSALQRTLVGSVWVSLGALAVITVPIALWLGSDPLGAFLGAFLVVAYSAYIFTRGVKLGEHRARFVALADAATSALAFAALVAVLVAGLEPLILVPISLGYAVFAVLSWPRRPKPRSAETAAGGEVDPAETRAALRFAAWNVLGGFATNGLLQLSMLAAQVLEPGIPAGLFAAAFSLATPASMLGQAVSQVVIPQFASQGRGAILRQRSAIVLMLGFTGVCAVAFGLIAALAPFVLPLLYGAAYQESVLILELLLVGVFVFTIGLIPAALLLAGGHSKTVSLVSAAGLVAGLVVLVVLATPLGMYAGIVAFGAGSMITLVLLIIAGSVERPQPDDLVPEATTG